MEEIRLKDKHTAKVYEGVHDLPIARYKKFNLYLLRDSGIGSDMTAIMTRLKKLDAYLAGDNINFARIERANLQLTFFTVLNEVDYKQMAFVCLLHSIDGEPIEDLSEGGILAAIKKLEAIGITQQFIMEMFEKKKTILPLN